MMRIFPLLVVGILFFSILGAGESTNNIFKKDIQESIDYDTLIFTVDFPNDNEYRIINCDNGQKIEIEDYNFLMIPGKPLMPSKNILIALPPNAKTSSIDVKGIEEKQLPGEYNIIHIRMPDQFLAGRAARTGKKL